MNDNNSNNNNNNNNNNLHSLIVFNLFIVRVSVCVYVSLDFNCFFF